MTIEQFVDSNVYTCLSGLISVLQSPEAQASMATLPRSSAMTSLLEATAELGYPVEDWEEAALQLGYKKGRCAWYNPGTEPNVCSTAKQVCEAHYQEPYYWEVYEYWVVSNYLADALTRQGEKIDSDFFGLSVWARTCTGQSISMDQPIINIFNQGA